jgi:hypothetical protein
VVNDEAGPGPKQDVLARLLRSVVEAGGVVALAAILTSWRQGLGPWFPLRLVGATFTGPGALVGGVGVILWGLLIYVAACALVASIHVWWIGAQAGWLRSGLAGVTLALAFYQLGMVLVLPRVNPYLQDRLLIGGATALVFPLLFGAGLAAGQGSLTALRRPAAAATRWRLTRRAAGPACVLAVGLGALAPSFGRADGRDGGAPLPSRPEPSLVLARRFIIDLCAVAKGRAKAPQAKRLAALLEADHMRLQHQTAALIDQQGTALMYPPGEPVRPAWRQPELRDAGIASRPFIRRGLREGHHRRTPRPPQRAPSARSLSYRAR